MDKPPILDYAAPPPKRPWGIAAFFSMMLGIFAGIIWPLLASLVYGDPDLDGPTSFRIWMLSLVAVFFVVLILGYPALRKGAAVRGIGMASTGIIATLLWFAFLLGAWFFA